MTKLLLYRVVLSFLVCSAVILPDALRVDAFSVISSGASLRTLPNKIKVKSLSHHDNHDNETSRDGDFEKASISRRAAIRNAAMIPVTLALFNPLPAVPYPGEAITNNEVDLECLKDLPPIEDGYVRLYLCRHGQTENNRLRIVQGARVDPPVNINGEAQATNLGLALACADPKPQLFFSSSLLRAKMTAEIAANADKPASSRNRVKPKQLSSLAEIDFGPVADGQPISAVQEKMEKAYTKWAFGDVDFRPEGGGDNGREVLVRVCEALEMLVNEAKAAGVPCVAAVTHSAYLRVLVGVVLDEPLVKSSIRKIRNGSVTVVDVPMDLNSRMLGSKPTLLGGPLSQKPKDFSLSVPSCNAVRINETRHLPLDKV
mmetsp:Transcript_21280/g.43767  ORF Transcript_21280/g.43767 Transcript_21280/m.43767 type:complete len:373 (+) Transcript_21280:44-1162(+)